MRRAVPKLGTIVLSVSMFLAGAGASLLYTYLRPIKIACIFLQQQAKPIFQ